MVLLRQSANLKRWEEYIKMLKSLKSLHVQVLIAIAAGISLGYFYPQVGDSMKPLGDGFIKLIKMIIAPIIFLTIVSGIAGMGDLKKVGRVGAKTLIYFEVITTAALIIGWLVVVIVQPGVGMNVDVSNLDTKAVAAYATASKNLSTIDFLMNIIPTTVVDAFTKGDLLQVLLISLMFGASLTKMGEKGRSVLNLINEITRVFFGMVHQIMLVAPIGVFGALAFTIGRFGIGSLIALAKLLGVFYATCLLFIFIVLGPVAWWVGGFSVLKFISFIKEELLIVFGTSSSESVLPRMLEKMEKLGCSKSVVGLVIPTGYSFNLDGTSIYLTMAAIFLAQATNTDLSFMQQLTIITVLLLTSKGASGVTGAGFIVLAATLSMIPTIPVAALAVIFGIDRFMSQGRALTNLVGNGVATIVMAAWENELDRDKMNRILNKEESISMDGH